MNRNLFYKNSLPYLDAMLQSQVDLDVLAGDIDHAENKVWRERCPWDSSQNLCILGPTENEIRLLMPLTAATIEALGGWWEEPETDDEGHIMDFPTKRGRDGKQDNTCRRSVDEQKKIFS
jgi:hypothetical protein